MDIWCRRAFFVVVGAIVLSSVGCDDSPAESDAESEQKDRRYHTSEEGVVIRLEGDETAGKNGGVCALTVRQGREGDDGDKTGRGGTANARSDAARFFEVATYRLCETYVNSDMSTEDYADRMADIREQTAELIKSDGRESEAAAPTKEETPGETDDGTGEDDEQDVVKETKTSSETGDESAGAGREGREKNEVRKFERRDQPSGFPVEGEQNNVDRGSSDDSGSSDDEGEPRFF